MTEKRNIDSFARPVTSNGCANLVFYSTHLPLSPPPSHQFSPLPSPNPESANRNPQRNTQNHQSLTRLIIMKHQPGRENQEACWGGDGGEG